ncbi:MAG: TrbC/VirB2 family protein [Acidobacteria bacterium]|nr:TrbC/VirB2 family protein [Acidobacteriota bacterium]
MRWYQKAGLSFVLGTGVLLCGVALFAVCPGRPLGMGLTVLSVGVLALFANVPWLSGFVRRRAFRAVIGMRRTVVGTLAAVRAALAAVVVEPLVLRRWGVVAGLAALFLALGADHAWASGPWETAVQALCNSFSGVIGKGLALVAVILGGLMFAFGEGGSKSAIAGLVFGAGMVLAAPGFLSWIGLSGAVC